MRRKSPPDPGFARGVAFALPPSLAFWGFIVWLILKSNGAQ